jgi:hypothetical protein
VQIDPTQVPRQQSLVSTHGRPIPEQTQGELQKFPPPADWQHGPPFTQRDPGKSEKSVAHSASVVQVPQPEANLPPQNVSSPCTVVRQSHLRVASHLANEGLAPQMSAPGQHRPLAMQAPPQSC